MELRRYARPGKMSAVYNKTTEDLGPDQYEEIYLFAVLGALIN